MFASSLNWIQTQIISWEKESHQHNKIIALQILELHKMKINKQRCDEDTKLLTATSSIDDQQIVSAFIYDHDFAPWLLILDSIMNKVVVLPAN